MTNYEWMIENKGELVKSIIKNAIGKEEGTLDYCTNINCMDCDFRKRLNDNQTCDKITKEWLEAEHEPLYKKGDVVIDKEGKLWVIDSVCDDTVGVYIKTSFSMSMSAIKIKDIAKKVGNIYDE